MKFPFELPLLLDGACATNLMKQGMPSNVCIEKWILEHPKIVENLQKEYIESGSKAILAPTFGANRNKLSFYNLGDKIDYINKKIVEISKKAVGDKNILIGGDMSSTGFMMPPYGNSRFDRIYDVYKEQAFALKEAGVDFIMLETLFTLSDIRAGILAVKETGLPCFVSISIEPDGFTVKRTNFLSALIISQEMGADAFGFNCSTGPDIMPQFIKEMKMYSKIPIIAKPNTGVSNADNLFQCEPKVEDFIKYMKDIMESGAEVVGGCCGTTPEYIKSLNSIINSVSYDKGNKMYEGFATCSEKEVFFFNNDVEFSKPITCNYDMVDDFIRLENEAGKVALVEINNIDEANLLLENVGLARLPLAILAYDIDLIEYILRNLQGRIILDKNNELPLIELQALADKYGAMLY